MSAEWTADDVSAGLAETAAVRPALLNWYKEILDQLSGASHSSQYYDAVAGDWLTQFLHLVYAGLSKPAQHFDQVITTAIEVHADPREFAIAASSGFNLATQICTAIARHQSGEDVDLVRASPKTRRAVRSVSQLTIRNLATRNANLLICGPTYRCNKSTWARALLAWRKWARWDELQYEIPHDDTLDCALRKRLAREYATANSRRSIYFSLLPLFVPISLLEGFSTYRGSVLALDIKRPKATYSTTSLHAHQTFKILAAEWREEGSQLLYHQHGGNYGLDKLHAIEQYERTVADRFYTWGWEDDDFRASPLSLPPPRSPTRRRRNRVMLNCLEMPRWVYRLHFQPMPGTMETLISLTGDFLYGLQNIDDVVVRLYPQNLGWEIRRKLLSRRPNLRFDDHTLSAYDRYSECQVVVHNYLGTSWLESLALNRPTVCFFDSDTYRFRDAALPYIDELIQLGVLHSSGSEAAIFVDQLGGDPEGWWMSVGVQDARRRFVEKYARFSQNWRKEWEQEFAAYLA